MISEWVIIHDIHFDLRRQKVQGLISLSDDDLLQIYRNKLKAYFGRYPDQLTDYYQKIINSK